MPNLSSASRFLAGAGLAAAALVALASPADARDRYGDYPPVRVAPELEREWLLQLSPGSGVVPGYKRPDLARGQVAAPASRRYPGYAAPGDVRGLAGYSTDTTASTRRFGYPAAPAARAAAVAVKRPGGLFERAAKPAPKKAGRELDPAFLPQDVVYTGPEKPGTVVIDTQSKFLYLVEHDGKARRYGVGVGKPGFEWAGRHQVTRKSEWPTWTPPEQMRERERAKGKMLPVRMDGGPENPLGARAMYLGSTLYRIHGTNQPWSIGKAVSSGCIRMRNEDVMDLYGRVPVGTDVLVL